MRFKFIGRHTNGATGITVFGHHFNGDEPTEVADEAVIARLKQNIEFKVVTGRPPKAAD